MFILQDLRSRYEREAKGCDLFLQRVARAQIAVLERGLRSRASPHLGDQSDASDRSAVVGDGAGLPSLRSLASQEQADEDSVALQALIAEITGPLQERSGGRMVGHCPWHASRSGTCLIIFPGGRRWWCSSCRRGGDAAAWIALTEGTDRSEALRRLADTCEAQLPLPEIVVEAGR